MRSPGAAGEQAESGACSAARPTSGLLAEESRFVPGFVRGGLR